MDNNVTTIKERALQIATVEGLSREEFCSSIGMSYGSFKGKAKDTPLNSDAVANILTKYPWVDAHWLITGLGDMKTAANYLPEESNSFAQESSEVYDTISKLKTLLNGPSTDFQSYLLRFENKMDSMLNEMKGISDKFEDMDKLRDWIEKLAINDMLEDEIKDAQGDR